MQNEGQTHMIYHICIQGVLDESWSDWLGNVEIRTGQSAEGPITTLTVDIVDQAALFGILDQIRDLNLALVSVRPQDDKLSVQNDAI
jgi:hypothetical protein